MAEQITSLLEIFDIVTGETSLVRQFDELIEAPNWTRDGGGLIYNAGGLIYRLDLEEGTIRHIPTGNCTACNNDHVLSADGSGLAISAGTADSPVSRIWVLPAAGGEPQLVTEEAPSYLHGWSPDGSTLAYCAQRGGVFDIYTIGRSGGPESRLTDSAGLDDGPEYSPDGGHIWFNSSRSGRMQVYRMNADGSKQQQMTTGDDRNSWFPHISPDGRQVVFIAYRAGEVEPGDHPPNKNVELRLMDAQGGEPRTVKELFGGQGTINVNSWAPDSRRFAYVRYLVN